MTTYNLPQDLIDYIKQLEGRIATLERTNPLNNGTVDEGGLIIRAASGLYIASGAGAEIAGGGSLAIRDGGAARVFGPTSMGTMESGRFGVVTLDAFGAQTYPSTVFTAYGFLADAGPGKGFAVFRVDETTGAAVVTSSQGTVLLPYSTTGSAANTRILLNGEIQMVTSSERYKRDIKTKKWSGIRKIVDKMRAVTFRNKNEVDREDFEAPTSIGFIAEEFHAIGLGAFVEYDDEGRPNAIAYDRLGAFLIEVDKDQYKLIDELRTEVTELRKLLDTLLNGETP